MQKKDEYEVAKNTLRSLGDYKDSEAQLCELELNNIDKSEVGTSVLFGEYKWLILEKNREEHFWLSQNQFQDMHTMMKILA